MLGTLNVLEYLKGEREGGREGERESQPLNYPVMFKLLSSSHGGENLDHLSKVTQLK